MARIYEVEGPDGKVYEVEADENATDSEIIAALQNRLGPSTPAPAPTQDPDEAFQAQLDADLERAKAARRERLLEEEGFFSTLGKGVSEGFTGTFLTAAEGAAGLLPDVENAILGEDVMEQIIDEARESTKFDTARRDDIEYLIGSGLGSVAAFFTPAVLALFAPVSATAATLVGGTALGMAAGAGEASQRVREARKQGIEVSDAQELEAELKGMFIGSAEALPFAKILRIPGLNKFAEAVSGEINADTFLRNIGQRIRSAAATGGAEAAQEVTAQILQNLTEQGYNPTKELIDAGALTDEAIAGGGAGAVIQAVADLFIKGRPRGADTDTTEQTRQEPTLDTAPSTPEVPMTETAREAEQTTLAAIERLNAQGVAAPTIDQIIQEVTTPTESSTTETSAAPEQTAEASFLDLVAGEQEKSTPTTTPQREEDALEALQRLTAAEPRSEGDTDVRPRGRDDSDRGDPVPTRPTAEGLGTSAPDGVLGVERTPATEGVPEGFKAPEAERLDRPEPLPEQPARREGLDTDPLTPNKIMEDAGIDFIPPLVAAKLKEEQSPMTATLDRIDKERAELEPVKEKLLADMEEGAQRRAAKLPVAPAKEPVAVEQQQPAQEPTTTLPTSEEVVDEIAKTVKTAERPAVADVADTSRKITDNLPTVDTKKAAQKLRAKQKRDAKRTTEQAIAAEVKALSKIRKEQQRVIPLQARRKQLEEAVAPEEVRQETSDLEFYTQPFSKKAVDEASFTDTDGNQRKIDMNKAVDADDATKILNVVKAKQPAQRAKESSKAKQNRAANIYFGKQQNPADALDVIAHESVFAEEIFRPDGSMSRGERQYFNQTGKKRAKEAIDWVRANLGKEANAQLDALIELHEAALAATKRQENTKVDRVATARKQAEQKRLEEEQAEKDYRRRERATRKQYLDTFDITAEDLDFLPDALRVDAVEIDTPLHPQVVNLINKGKLVEALRALSTTTASKEVTKLASKLAKYVGTTKLQTKSSLLNAEGSLIAGQFDPKTNTITLDAEKGINAHTLLHEMVHAATSATLSNKSHPVTKQLTKLFNDVKDSLDSYYGGKNVDEFVAEAFSSAKFQSKLGAINPNGSPITALQRFLNTVGNFLRNVVGLDSKPIGSAQDSFNKIADALLSPSPETRDAGALSMASGADNVSNVVSQLRAAHQNAQNAPSMSRSAFADSVVDFLYPATKVVRNVLLGSLGTKSIADVSRRVSERLGNVGTMLHETIERQRGKIQESDAEVRAVAERFAKWGKENKEAKAALDRVIYSTEFGATIFQVDPNKPASAYLNKDGKPKFDKSGNNLYEIRKKQQRHWDEAGEEGKKYFNEMRNLYASKYEQLRKVIYGEIDRLVPSTTSSNRLKKNVYQQLFEKSKLEVYFPLVRQGQYILKITDTQPADPAEGYVVLAFESPSARDRAAALAQEKEGVTVETVDSGNLTIKDYSNVPPSSFVGETLQILKANKVDDAVIENFMRLFLDALPESSFAKSLQKRKNVTGFVEDSLVGLRTKAMDIGRQAVKLEYGAKYREISDQLSKIEKLPRQQGRGATSLAGKAKDKFATELDMIVEMKKRLKFASSGASMPRLEKLAVGANQLAFNYTIGFNVSSFVVNSSQIPLFAYPYMAMKYSWAEAGSALGYASKLSNTLVPGVGGVEQVNDFYDVDKDGNYTVKQGLDIEPEMQSTLEYMAPAVKEAAERGYLGRSYLLDVLGVNEGGRETQGGKVRKFMDKFTSLSAYGFNLMERYNRQTVLFANYKLNRDAMESKPRVYSETQGKFIRTADLTSAQKDTLAAQEAIYQAEQLNGGLALETAPRLTQQHIGRVAFMYKTYGANMYYTMLKSAARVIDSDVDPELRKQAFKELAAVHLSSAFFAGIHGMPIYGIVKMMFGLYDYMFGEDDDEDFDTQVRKYMGEGFYKGGLNQVLDALGVPVDVATRTRLTGLIFQENRFAQNESTEEFLFRMLLGPAGSTYKRAERAVNDFSEGEFERGFENALPPSLANALKASFGRYRQDDAILTRRGDPIVDDITQGELIGQMLGFAPTRYTFEQERNQVLKNIDRKIVTKRTKLVRKLYIALRRGDTEGRRNAIKLIKQFNKRYGRTDARIDMDFVRRSISQHRKSSAKMHNGVTISSTNRRYIQELSDGWG